MQRATNASSLSLPGSSIDPVTGRVEEKPPNPMDGMTEEQKEHEAMKLVNMFDKLSRCVAWRGGPCCAVHPGRWGGTRASGSDEAVSCLKSPAVEKIPEVRVGVQVSTVSILQMEAEAQRN